MGCISKCKYFCGMKVSYQTSMQFFNKLNLLFNGIIAGTLLPFGILFLGRQKEMFPALLEGTIGIVITVIILVLAIYLTYQSHHGFKISFKEYSKEMALREKMDFYYDISVRRYYYLGGASLCAMIGLLLNTHGIFSLFYLIVLFMFSLGRPEVRKMMDQLALNEEERKLVYDKLEIK